MEQIRSGDTVKHVPSGETRLVAWADEKEVISYGWPERIARIEDCVLLKSADDESYWDMVCSVAASRESLQGMYCRHILDQIDSRECERMMHT